MRALSVAIKQAIKLALLLALPLAFSTSVQGGEITLSFEQAKQIGDRIFQNECAGKEALLTSWNRGEAFPSLGIGHFIWYPKQTTGPFKESFPALLAFMQARGALIPAWLQIASKTGAPWPSREAFLTAQDAPHMQRLRTLLADTKELQTAFMVERLNRARPDMLASLPAAEQAAVEQRFMQVAAAPMGYYALIDYVNFKGEGTAPGERYQGQGWGLLQVLQAMETADDPVQALHNFAAAAQNVLQRRVNLSPPARHEERWLAGWNKRIATYLPQP